MPSTMKTPAAISPKEVAEGLSMSRRQVYRWIDNEELPTNQIDGYHKITEGQLAEKVGEEMAGEVFRRVAEAKDE
ncbi:helix-turn-helix domain-containing protein [Salinibacter ruber]|jgi:excisionase family DNA binding protein|uniref:helix-turn-helix domain-containing protein n=1 Tax=Salinibacter ruber TaxID=146919 RepID=UPI002166D674|nr:helix-turn-helix domain-containing protein [Salinibacter ruber]MCS3629288.1 excisionase family DNA binding protein [Salinibacter ruber]MCS4119612.1 excisionase family DNA binding protein [Salinibacter ruber]MCS4146196.1 excisionase family DNA binding protein [Salinibacter ruber]